MTARDLFEAVGLVDEELIEDADAAAPRRRPVLTLRRALPLAACLCLAAGAAFAWRASPWNGAGTQSEAATAPQMAAAPDTAAAAPEQQAAGGAEGAGTQEEKAAERESAVQDSAMAAGLPESLAQAVTPAAGNGNGPALAADVQELVGSPAQDAALPESMTLYRSVLASRTLDEDGMRETMRTVLEALGQDPELAGGAELVYNWSDDQIENADQIAGELRQQFGVGSELEFWGGMAQLELTLPDGGSLTVRNDRDVSLEPAEETPVHPATAEELEANAGLLDALGGYRTLLSAAGGHSWADGSAGSGTSALVRSDGPGSVTGLLADESGVLAGFRRDGSAEAEAVGEYAVIAREEAEALLGQGVYLGADAIEADPAAGTVADARLCYVEGAALYYVPMWRFVVDMGVPDGELYPTADPDTGAELHAYYTYYVPAVGLDTLADALGTADTP